MKTVLVTGASGFLGRNLVKSLLQKEGCSVIAAGRSKEKLLNSERALVLSNQELFQKDSLDADIVINCAFARGNQTKMLVSAIDFNEQLICRLKQWSIPSVINISSQGIYRSVRVGEFLDERGDVEPKESYALAKYAQERMFTSNFEQIVTNIRLASLSANARFVQFFIDSVIHGREIVVTAPEQYVSLIDISDAVSGIVKTCELSPDQRKTVYNLGIGMQVSILRIAELVIEAGIVHGYQAVPIKVEDCGKQVAVGMNCTRLRMDTGWKPKMQIEDMIESLFQNAVEG